MNNNISIYTDSSILIMINTPFQALCAIEAIKKYGISNYKLVVAYFYNESRINQIKNVLELYNVSYVLFELSKLSVVKEVSLSLFKKNEYSVAFIGDFYTILASFISVLSIKTGGKIVYMDDGNSTIDIFKDQLAPSKITKSFKVLRGITYCISRLKKISTETYFFSMFHDIPNPKYIVEENKFTNISSINESFAQTPCSFFIGTFSDIFCSENNISKVQFYNTLDEFLRIACSQTNNLIYIPHGRDNDMKVKLICDSHGVEYKRLDVCIELFLIQNKIIPTYVFGFSSSALYTVKKLFPSSRVFNGRIISRHTSQEYEDIAEYYQRHGISNIVFNV